MPSLQLLRRTATWIAVLAVLIAALAPAISHALRDQGKVSWVEVCTAQGSMWFKGAIDSKGDSMPGLGHTLDHCPYCSLHGNVAGVLPASLQGLPAPALAQAVPHAFLAARRTLHAWMSAQPRAPPPVS
jgi:hypothetical protein